MEDDQLVFIVSQPRAGSTLLQAILSNHPNVDTISEHWMLLQFAALLKPSLIKADFDAFVSQDAFATFLKARSVDKEFERDVKALLLSYYAKIQTSENNLVIDKTPRYYEILPEILDLFPRAKIILLIRNPLASWVSMMKTWGRFDNYVLCLHHRRDILQAPLLIHRFCQEHIADDRVKKITYENLLAAPEKIVANLCQWLDISFSPAMLDYSNNVKYQGKYGDPIGVKRNSRIQVTRRSSWKGYQENKYYDNVLNGYAHFLGKPFLYEYGSYQVKTAKPTIEFGFFKFYCDNFGIFEKYSLKQLGRVMVKYFFGKFCRKIL